MEPGHHSPCIAALVEAERTVLRLPSRPDWIEPTTDYLVQKALLSGACEASRKKKLMVSLQEALVNAVVHGNLEIPSQLKEQGDNAFAEALAARSNDARFARRTVAIEVEYDGERCQWSITDEGRGFDVDRVLRRESQGEPEFVLASGRGILMMQAFMDDVRFEAGGRRVVLALRKSTHEEKRQHTRRAMQKRVRIAPIQPDGSVDWAAAHEALTNNLSEQGITLLQGRLEATNRILLGIDAEGEPLYLPAEIRHWRVVGENVIEVGCRFQTRPGAPNPSLDGPNEQKAFALIDALIKRFGDQPVPHDERRNDPRVIYTERIGIRGPSGTEPEFGFARDLSKGGIAFITTAPLPLGMLDLSLPQGTGKSPLPVRAQVVRCVKIMEGFHDVGARFVGS